MISRRVSGLLAVAAFALAACGKSPADPGADLIITGGPILTMEGAGPTSAEAVAADDGRIVFVGSTVDALKRKDDGTVVKDLAGKTLMSGFIDGHAQPRGGASSAARPTARPRTEFSKNWPPFPTC